MCRLWLFPRNTKEQVSIYNGFSETCLCCNSRTTCTYFLARRYQMEEAKLSWKKKNVFTPHKVKVIKKYFFLHWKRVKYVLSSLTRWKLIFLLRNFIRLSFWSCRIVQSAFKVKYDGKIKPRCIKGGEHCIEWSSFNFEGSKSKLPL